MNQLSIVLCLWKDDLVSLFHVLVYLLVGHLPWMGVAGSTDAENCAAVPLPAQPSSGCGEAGQEGPHSLWVRRVLTEQRFLQTYRYEWMEECGMQTVLVEADENRPSSPIVELELPKLKRSKADTLEEGKSGSFAWTRSKSTPLLTLLGSRCRDNPKTDIADDTKNDDRMSPFSPNPKEHMPPPVVHNPDSTLLIPLSSTFYQPEHHFSIADLLATPTRDPRALTHLLDSHI
ncbi:hypothetical protein BLNAU_21933 [Blattamonas nauphoetae]|uniref:Uncharacterized protein n=1 Tax=Blattamonas nauphoetae TaxID=2049346 RepID=A0ABQ9WYT6_9EUKA|nr:hypothetical protein BLNAU_21933 [Blattamonas nauphoetae]